MKSIEAEDKENQFQIAAKKRVKKIKDFYIHSFIFLIGIVMYVLKTYYGVSFNFFPIDNINLFVMGIWAIFYVIQAIELLITERVFGKKWEEEKIKNFINKEQETKTWE